MAARTSRRTAPGVSHLVDADTLHPEVVHEADAYEEDFQRQDFRDAKRKEKISRSAPSFGLLRFGWRKLKDLWYLTWHKKLGHIKAGTEAVAYDSKLKNAYYNLGPRTFRYAEASKRDAYRMGFLKNALNTNPKVHEFAEGIIRDLMVENLEKIKITGIITGQPGQPAVRRTLKQMSIKELTDLYDRVEVQSLPHNRTRRSSGKIVFDNDAGGVDVDEKGFVLPKIDISEIKSRHKNNDGSYDVDAIKVEIKAKLPQDVASHRRAVMSPTDFWDRGVYNTETHSDLVRTLFTRKEILESIMDHWKLSGHNLGMVLAMRRGALVSQVRSAVFPDSVEHEDLPVSATNNQMDAAVRLANAFGVTHTHATHYFWLIRGNCPNMMAVSQLKREVTELETIKKQWRDYYHKPGPYTPDMIQRREAATGAAFSMLMRENLDLPQDQLKERISHIMHVFADTTVRDGVQQTRLNRMLECANKLRELRLLRMTLANPNVEETAKIYATRQRKYGIKPEEAEQNYLRMVRGTPAAAAPQAPPQAQQQAA